MSIIQFRRAKLLQDAKLSGVTVADIARAMATMDGVQALSRFDDGFTSHYFSKAEALLDLAIECALERPSPTFWLRGIRSISEGDSFHQ